MDRRVFLAAGTAAAAMGASAEAQTPHAYSEAIAYHEQRAGTGLVVLRNGVTLVEHGGAQNARAIGAATTSFTPALAAALVGDRLMTLDEPASATLLEWALDPVKSRITLRMLLDRTCGISGRGREMSDFEACGLAPIADPGERFIDDAAPMQIFAEVARRKLSNAGRPSDPAAYVSLRALAPVGCQVSWRRRNSEPSFTHGAAVSARGWARWGELMRRVGVWRAAPLLDASALRDACRGSWQQPRYGFGLWLAWPASAEAPLYEGSDLWSARPAAPQDLVMAASENGDRLFILPTQRLVIARQAERASAWSDATFVRLFL